MSRYQWCWVCIQTDRNSGRSQLCCCSCDHTHHSDPYTHQHLKETQWYQGTKFCNSSTLDSKNFRFHFPFDLKSVCIGPVQVQIDKQINQNEERIKRNKMKLVHIDKGRLIIWTICFQTSFDNYKMCNQTHKVIIHKCYVRLCNWSTHLNNVMASSI